MCGFGILVRPSCSVVAKRKANKGGTKAPLYILNLTDQTLIPGPTSDHLPCAVCALRSVCSFASRGGGVKMEGSDRHLRHLMFALICLLAG